MTYTEKRDHVVIVDMNDQSLGAEEKLRAHQNGGKLHRAFSVVIFDAEGRILLQQRASDKYHFASLWTNACCSHPQPGESIDAAADSRLQYEMGIQTKLRKLCSFVYHAHDIRSGLSEHEYDHVYIGKFNGLLRPNVAEVSNWKWLWLDEIVTDLTTSPHYYTPWFHILMGHIIAHQRAGEITGGHA